MAPHCASCGGSPDWLRYGKRTWEIVCNDCFDMLALANSRYWARRPWVRGEVKLR